MFIREELAKQKLVAIGQLKKLSHQRSEIFLSVLMALVEISLKIPLHLQLLLEFLQKLAGSHIFALFRTSLRRFDFLGRCRRYRRKRAW